jgi:hypothetical protein
MSDIDGTPAVFHAESDGRDSEYAKRRGLTIVKEYSDAGKAV